MHPLLVVSATSAGAGGEEKSTWRSLVGREQQQDDQEMAVKSSPASWSLPYVGGELLFVGGFVFILPEMDLDGLAPEPEAGRADLAGPEPVDGLRCARVGDWETRRWRRGMSSGAGVATDQQNVNKKR